MRNCTRHFYPFAVGLALCTLGASALLMPPPLKAATPAHSPRNAQPAKEIQPMATAKPDALNPEMPYQAEQSNRVTYAVDFSAVVTPPQGCKVLKVWLPLPPSNEAQQVRDSRLSTFPIHVEPQIATEKVYGNRFAYFEFHRPQGAQIIRHRFQATVAEMNWNVEQDKVLEVAQWPAAFEPYLQSHQIQQQEALEKVLVEIRPNSKQGLSTFAAAMRWVNENLEYDHAKASLRADVDHALTFMRGHCSDYHGLCATLGRSLGYPTRVTYGLSLYPKNSPSHCKLEAYLPPYGWVSFDLSETQKLVDKIGDSDMLAETDKRALADATWKRLQRGFRENCWLLVTRGTNYQLAPRASRPVSVVRTIYAEADGEPLPEPDPANPHKREFGWMTVHHYQADGPLRRFNDLDALRAEIP